MDMHTHTPDTGAGGDMLATSFTPSAAPRRGDAEASALCLPCIVAGSAALALMSGVAACLVWWICRLWFG